MPLKALVLKARFQSRAARLQRGAGEQTTALRDTWKPELPYLHGFWGQPPFKHKSSDLEQREARLVCATSRTGAAATPPFCPHSVEHEANGDAEVPPAACPAELAAASVDTKSPFVLPCLVPQSLAWILKHPKLLPKSYSKSLLASFVHSGNPCKPGIVRSETKFIFVILGKTPYYQLSVGSMWKIVHPQTSQIYSYSFFLTLVSKAWCIYSNAFSCS